MQGKNRLDVDKKIDDWGRDRGITVNGKPMSQFTKTLEEVAELLTAMNNKDMAETKDAIGDIYVTLRMLCGTLGISMETCIDLAYDEIKDRTGYLSTAGVFVKDK